MIRYCPFCLNRWERSVPKKAIQFEYTALLSKHHEKWIAVCQEHFENLLRMGIACRKNDVVSQQEVEQVLRFTKVVVRKSWTPGQIYPKNPIMSKQLGTLDHHVLEAVKSLVNDGASFSAHDITRQLRKRINNQEAEIIGRPYKDVPTGSGGIVKTQWIDHAEIRDRVHQMYEQGLLPTGLTRDTSKGYVEYTPPSAGGGLPAGNAVAASPFGPNAVSTSSPTTMSGSVTLPKPASFLTGIASSSPGPSSAHVPVAFAPPPAPAAPPVDPLLRLTEKNQKVIRLRLKANQKYLVLPNGRTAWRRRSDLSLSLNGAGRTGQEIRKAIEDSRVEEVTL